ncbi:MAG: YjbE family putative metal transport protein, partial [Selenomonadales bacterium]|nr:YjbE family putative metal transport protein [Selenomonadales bacterium]
MFSASWFFALGSILLLDLLLSGDNAIIIALACKNLPAEQRKKAVFLGCAGAIILRVLLTLVATKLLEIPYLQFIGGVALLFIAIKLLKPEEEDLSNIESSGKLWAAIKTILAADFIMSLDNVLSLAAVAQTV